MAANEETDGASIKELLVEACRRNNTDLLTELLADKPDAEISRLLNQTTTVMGNHLYHEAASHGNYEIIDLLLDQPDFECDPINRSDGDTPLHVAIRWLNAEPPAQRPFGLALVGMMLEAGSSTRIRNRARLTPYQLVDPSNHELRDLLDRHEYAEQNAGDFANTTTTTSNSTTTNAVAPPPPGQAPAIPHGQPPPPPRPHQQQQQEDESDDDAEFSGSDEEERAEWERRRRNAKR